MATLPMAFLGASYFTTANHVLRRRWPSPGLGRLLTGAAFISSGLHFLDFPLMADRAWFVPYGLLLAVDSLPRGDEHALGATTTA